MSNPYERCEAGIERCTKTCPTFGNSLRRVSENIARGVWRESIVVASGEPQTVYVIDGGTMRDLRAALRGHELERQLATRTTQAIDLMHCTSPKHPHRCGCAGDNKPRRPHVTVGTECWCGPVVEDYRK